MSSFNLTETGGGSNTVGVSAPASISSNFVLKLPAADGSANQVIKTDGSGNLSFTTGVSDISYVTVEDQISGDITWGSSYNSTTQSLGNVSNATGATVFAISFSVYYSHGGSTNHGYLSGDVHQTNGSSTATKCHVRNYHYDWYYNLIQQQFTLPWNPSGTQSLSIYVTNAYNTSTSNVYRFYHSGTWSTT